MLKELRIRKSIDVSRQLYLHECLVKSEARIVDRDKEIEKMIHKKATELMCNKGFKFPYRDTEKDMFRLNEQGFIEKKGFKKRSWDVVDNLRVLTNDIGFRECLYLIEVMMKNNREELDACKSLRKEIPPTRISWIDKGMPHTGEINKVSITTYGVVGLYIYEEGNTSYLKSIDVGDVDVGDVFIFDYGDLFYQLRLLIAEYDRMIGARVELIESNYKKMIDFITEEWDKRALIAKLKEVV